MLNKSLKTTLETIIISNVYFGQTSVEDYINATFDLNEIEYRQLIDKLKSAFEISELICFELRDQEIPNYENFQIMFKERFPEALNSKCLHNLYNQGMISSK